jgi:hypothetical protein
MAVVCVHNQHLYCSRLCAQYHGENAELFDDVASVDVPFGRRCDNCGRPLSAEKEHIVDLVVRVKVATTSEGVDAQKQAQSFIRHALDTHRRLSTSFYDQTVGDFRRLEITAMLME